MIDKKTFVLAVVVSWILTLATVLLVDNIATSLTQAFNPQFKESNSIKVVNLQKQEVKHIEKTSGLNMLLLNFNWSPSNPKNNAILEIVCSFEYMVTTELTNQLHLASSITVNFHQSSLGANYRYQSSLGSTNSYGNVGDWELISYKVSEGLNWINPNQNEYTINLTNQVNNNQTYIRNVNLTLLVIDG